MKRKHTTGREVSLLRRESDRLRREVSRLQTDNVELQSEVFRLAVPLAHVFCTGAERGNPNIPYPENLFMKVPLESLLERFCHLFNPPINRMTGSELTIFGNRAFIRGRLVVITIKRDMRIGDIRQYEMFEDFGFVRISPVTAFCLIERISPEELNQ